MNNEWRGIDAWRLEEDALTCQCWSRLWTKSSCYLCNSILSFDPSLLGSCLIQPFFALQYSLPTTTIQYCWPIMSIGWQIEGELTDTMPVQRRDGLEVSIASDSSTAAEQQMEGNWCLKQPSHHIICAMLIVLLMFRVLTQVMVQAAVQVCIDLVKSN